MMSGERTTAVAVVEDHPDTLALMMALLARRYDATGYADAESAIEGLRANRPDIVLCDIGLPVMDGIGLLRLVRADEVLADVPVVAVTTNALEATPDDYLAMGFDSFLPKPVIDRATLWDTIDRLVGADDGAGTS